MTTVHYDFIGTNGASLPAPWSTVSGTIDIQGNAARLTKAAGATFGTLGEAQHGSTTHADVDIVGRLIRRNSSNSVFEYRYRSKNSNADEYRFVINIAADNSVLGWFDLYEGGSKTGNQLGIFTMGFTVASGVAFWHRLNVSGTTHQFKMWADAGSEPGSWSSSITNSSISSAGITTMLYADEATSAQYVDVDDLTINDFLVEKTRLMPDTIISATNLSGAVSVIQDDPDSPDANWLTAP